jgi:hypothetical protein
VVRCGSKIYSTHFGRVSVRLLRLAAATAAASALAILIPATATATTAERTASGVEIYKSRQTDKQIREFWTPTRMKEAFLNPAEAPTAAPDRGRRSATVSAPRRQTASAPARGFLAKTTTPQRNTTAAAMPVSQEVPGSTVCSVVGKLFFTLPNGEAKSCSASSIVSANENTIWTAGHCVHTGDGSGDAGWTRNLMYLPGYRYGNEPIGSWTAAWRHAPSAWTQDGDTREADMAAIVLNSDPVLGTLENAVGAAFGHQFAENATDYANVAAIGYPVEGYQRNDLDGERMMYCAGDTTDASFLNPFDDRLKIDCDMGHASSGGPYIWGPQNDPRIIGAISHHEADATTLERINDDLFSSEHGTYAAAVINAVNGA